MHLQIPQDMMDLISLRKSPACKTVLECIISTNFVEHEKKLSSLLLFPTGQFLSETTILFTCQM